MKRSDHALINILESIAAEEEALAKIVGAEAEKVRAFVAMVHHQQHPMPTVDDLISFNTVVNRLLMTVLTKELVLLNKLDVAAALLRASQEAEQQQEEQDTEQEEDNEEDNEEDDEENEVPFR